MLQPTVPIQRLNDTSIILKKYLSIRGSYTNYYLLFLIKNIKLLDRV